MQPIVNPSTENRNSVSILLEVLPYIRQFSGTTIVIKYGGAAMEEKNLSEEFARDIVLLQFVGIKPIVVHGGGPKITKILQQLQLPSEFINGMRVTDSKSMEVVEMVLSGNINKEIVSQINKEGGRAVGISGRDGKLAVANSLSVNRLTAQGENEIVSLGQVGEVNARSIDGEIIKTLEKNGYVPVIAPVANNAEGQAMNVNADTMAGAIASYLKAKKLILLTDTPGVIIDNETKTKLSLSEIEKYKIEKKITGGMIPKVDCCIQALESGVEKTHIIDGREPHAILLEVFTDKGVGTMITM